MMTQPTLFTSAASNDDAIQHIHPDVLLNDLLPSSSKSVNFDDAASPTKTVAPTIVSDTEEDEDYDPSLDFEMYIDETYNKTSTTRSVSTTSSSSSGSSNDNSNRRTSTVAISKQPPKSALKRTSAYTSTISDDEEERRRRSSVAQKPIIIRKSVVPTTRKNNKSMRQSIVKTLLGMSTPNHQSSDRSASRRSSQYGHRRASGLTSESGSKPRRTSVAEARGNHNGRTKRMSVSEARGHVNGGRRSSTATSSSRRKSVATKQTRKSGVVVLPPGESFSPSSSSSPRRASTYNEVWNELNNTEAEKPRHSKKNTKNSSKSNKKRSSTAGLMFFD